MHTDALIRLSRRSLWTAFILIALIGALGMVQLLAPAWHTAHHLRLLLPVFLAIGSVALRRVPNAGMQIVLDDELRQMALARAYRVALFAVLVLQPVLALGLTASGVANALALMAVATLLTGALAFIATVLYVDR